MEKIKWTWKKIVSLIAGFLGIGTLVSCYGVLPQGEELSISGTVTGEVDGVEKPIPGIEVHTYENETKTDKNGKYETTIFSYCDYVRFLDVDGEENGLFEEYYLFPEAEGSYDIHLEAYKEPENPSEEQFSIIYLVNST